MSHLGLAVGRGWAGLSSTQQCCCMHIMGVALHTQMLEEQVFSAEVSSKDVMGV